jgi:hypothetical protein
MNSTPFQTAFDELKALGLVLRQEPGQYRVNFRNGTARTEYMTDDLRDAVTQGREMAAHPPPPSDPPLGPTGPRSSRRGLMYRHNRKDAARRRRKQSESA